MCLVLVNSLDVPFYYFSSRIYLFVAKVLLARLPRLPQCCVLHACLLLLCLLLLVVHLAPPSGTLCNQSFPASALYHYRQSVEYSRANNNPCSCVLPYPRPHHWRRGTTCHLQLQVFHRLQPTEWPRFVGAIAGGPIALFTDIGNYTGTSPTSHHGRTTTSVRQPRPCVVAHVLPAYQESCIGKGQYYGRSETWHPV